MFELHNKQLVAEMVTVCQRNKVFIGVERKLLEEQFKADMLNDKASGEKVDVIISHLVNHCQETKVTCWVDNFKSSLKKRQVQSLQNLNLTNLIT